MLRRWIILFLWAPAVWGQWPTSSDVTNKPLPYSAGVLVPQATVPQVTVPQATTIEVPLTSTPVPPAARAPQPGISPFKPVAAIPNPTAADMARHNVHPVAPPLPAVTAAAAKPFLPAAGPGGPVPENYRYVAPGGNDANSGAREQPWQTIQHAADWAQPGAVVVIQPGTYEPFHTVYSGTVDQPITFRAAGDVIIGPPGGQQPVERRAHNLLELYQLNNIHIQNCDYTIIEGFQVQRAGRCGICVMDSHGVMLRSNVVSAAGVFGILTSFGIEVQILNNKIFGTLEQHGIYVSNSRIAHDQPVVRGNDVYANAGNGIQVNGDCQMGGDGIITEAVIENNVVHDNGGKGLSLISMSDSLVQNNLIYHNGKVAGAGGIHLTDELGCHHPSSGNVVVNNTVVEPTIAGLRLTDGAADNIVFNNLLISPQPLVDEAGENKIDKVSNVCLHSSAGVFVDMASANYHLLATGPATGLGLGQYFQKAAPLTDRDGHRRNLKTGFDAGAY